MWRNWWPPRREGMCWWVCGALWVWHPPLRQRRVVLARIGDRHRSEDGEGGGYQIGSGAGVPRTLSSVGMVSGAQASSISTPVPTMTVR